MNDTFDEKEQIDKAKKNQTLTIKQKFLFGMICWGVQSWNQAESFKTNGYNQKYIDAKKAIYTGLTIYGIGIKSFILLLIFLS